MKLDLLSVIPVVLVLVSSLVLLVSYNWRTAIVALVVQYVAIFLFTMQVWPVGLAAVKIVAGWMAGAVLGASQISVEAGNRDRTSSAQSIFRLLAGGFISLVAISLGPTIADWFPASLTTIWGGLVLISMGLLQIGMTTRPFQSVIGLLTTLSGFEIMYASLEESVLVAGLLAVVTLGLALTGAYLIMPERQEERP